MQLEFSVILCNFHIVRKPSIELLRNKEKQMPLLTNHRGNAKVIAIFDFSCKTSRYVTLAKSVLHTQPFFVTQRLNGDNYKEETSHYDRQIMSRCSTILGKAATEGDWSA